MSLKQFILKYFTYPLQGKFLIKSKYFRLYCDGGQPIFGFIPRISNKIYHSYWNMTGFVVTWLGRQIFFSFKKDTNGFYKDCGGLKRP